MFILILPCLSPYQFSVPPQAPVLCRHFDDLEDSYFEGKRAVELGSGTGLLGLYVAKRGNRSLCLRSHAVKTEFLSSPLIHA